MYRVEGNNNKRRNPMATIYKFSETATATAGTAKTLQELKEYYMAGGYQMSIHNLLQYGHEKIMGWCYDYRDELKQFYYSDKYGNTARAYAPNKTCLRKAIYGTIYDIVEIK